MITAATGSALGTPDAAAPPISTPAGTTVIPPSPPDAADSQLATTPVSSVMTSVPHTARADGRPTPDAVAVPMPVTITPGSAPYPPRADEPPTPDTVAVPMPSEVTPGSAARPHGARQPISAPATVPVPGFQDIEHLVKRAVDGIVNAGTGSAMPTPPAPVPGTGSADPAVPARPALAAGMDSAGGAMPAPPTLITATGSTGTAMSAPPTLIAGPGSAGAAISAPPTPIADTDSAGPAMPAPFASVTSSGSAVPVRELDGSGAARADSESAQGWAVAAAEGVRSVARAPGAQLPSILVREIGALLVRTLEWVIEAGSGSARGALPTHPAPRRAG